MLDHLIKWFVILLSCGVTIMAFLMTVVAISVAVNPLIIPN
jgi:hypothetical protein